MAYCSSNNTTYTYPLSDFGDMYGDQSCSNYNNHWSCESTPQHPYLQPGWETEALRHMGIKNYSVSRTLDGQTLYKPIDDRDYSCECSMESSENCHCNRTSYKHEARKGRHNKGCDCHKRGGKQDQWVQGAPDRWRCHGAQGPRSAATRAQCGAHRHQRPGSSQHPQCSCGH